MARATFTDDTDVAAGGTGRAAGFAPEEAGAAGTTFTASLQAVHLIDFPSRWSGTLGKVAEQAGHTTVKGMGEPPGGVRVEAG
jgi:hypothetical protein